MLLGWRDSRDAQDHRWGDGRESRRVGGDLAGLVSGYSSIDFDVAIRQPDIHPHIMAGSGNFILCFDEGQSLL